MRLTRLLTLLGLLAATAGCLGPPAAESSEEHYFGAVFAPGATDADHERARTLVETRGGRAEIAHDAGEVTLLASGFDRDACMRARAAVEALATIANVSECNPNQSGGVEG